MHYFYIYNKILVEISNTSTYSVPMLREIGYEVQRHFFQPEAY